MVFTESERRKLLGMAGNEVRDTRTKIRSLERSLNTKGYQKSANRPKYYARMQSGLVPYDNAKDATEAHHAEVRQLLEAEREKLNKLLIK